MPLGSALVPAACLCSAEPVVQAPNPLPQTDHTVSPIDSTSTLHPVNLSVELHPPRRAVQLFGHLSTDLDIKPDTAT